MWNYVNRNVNKKQYSLTLSGICLYILYVDICIPYWCNPMGFIPVNIFLLHVQLINTVICIFSFALEPQVVQSTTTVQLLFQNPL